MTTATQTTTYYKYDDPGHGWLQVPLTELDRLNITFQISVVSYRKGEFAYLEEDCDMSRFLRAKEAAGEEFKIHRIYEDGGSKIRGYRSF